MNPENITKLRIDSSKKKRPKRFVLYIFLAIIAVSAAAVYFARPQGRENMRFVKGTQVKSPTNSTPTQARNPSKVEGSILTVSGYIVNKERIELSPRFVGTVKWIGVKKGDSVTNGQIVVLLDDAEYKARVLETEGRLASARANVEKAQLSYNRVLRLAKESLETVQAQDDSRLQLEMARALEKEVEGQLALAKTYLEWTIIRSPIDGVVLEKLVDPNELVVPQSFGGTRGPSTALIALANPKELQVEVEINESDLPKIFLNQLCKVSPEAFPEHSYDGYVAEVAPEANRQKGTLQIKVQIRNPDRYLTPELSARVDFIGGKESPATTEVPPAPTTARN